MASVGAAVALVSTVKGSGAELPLVLPAVSVLVVVTLCAPSASAVVGVKLHLPSAPAVVVPISWPLS